MEELKKALEENVSLQVANTKLEAERDSEKARADRLEAERDSEKARADKVEAERADAAANFDRQVEAKAALFSKAKAYLGEEFDCTSKSVREIHCEIVKKLDGAEIPEGKSDEYVEARYDAAVENANQADASHRSARSAIDKSRDDGAPQDLEAKAKAAQQEYAMNAWKTQTPAQA